MCLLAANSLVTFEQSNGGKIKRKTVGERTLGKRTWLDMQQAMLMVMPISISDSQVEQIGGNLFATSSID